jgi:ABC-type sugar transport system ATPase subunit/ribose/xylose/arabinose/galactoside ABC-type transport system permease subunit
MALTIAGASKRFRNTLALDGVNLSVAQGTVCALVGANGSGKSTLIRALAGYHMLDAGVVQLHGQELNAHRMAEQGKAAGLRFVHQDLALIPNLSIADNLAMERGYVVGALGGISWRREEDRVRRELNGVGVSAAPRERVADLGPVDRTLVAIARALDHLDSSRNVLILDEPTARLPQGEASKLISRLQALKRRGLPIVYVTHRLDEVYRLADTVTVLRDGRETFSGPLSTLAGDDLRWLITGTTKTSKQLAGRDVGPGVIPDQEVVLELRNVSSQRLKGVSLQLHRGEVLGVTGLIGSGRSELGRIVYGLQSHASGDIRIGGRLAGSHLSDALTSQRIAYIPQERRTGLFPSLSVQDNVTITAADRLARWYGLPPRRLLDAARGVIRTLQVKPDDPRVTVNVLSGGNQQKVALGKWLQLPLDIFILDEPTQSIDIGTKQDLMTTIKERARTDGLAVLWLESDIEELIRYADRIIVMSAGRISAEFTEPPFDLAQVLAEAYRMVEDPTEEKEDAAHAQVSSVERGPPRGPPLAALGWVWSLLHNYGLLVALVALAAAFSVLRPDTFPTAANAGSILTGSAALAMIAIGVMLPLIVQQFDLSPGFMATLASLLVVGFQSFNHSPVWLAIGAAILVCGLIGLLSGILIAYARLNSLIVTLAVGSLLFGASELYSNGATIYQGIPRAFLTIGQSRFAGIPLPFMYVAVAALIIWYILEYRPLGRYLYAIGGGEEAARLVGIKVDRLIVLMFVASAVMAGLGGVVQAARVGSANASILQTLLLPAFTAAFLGATSIRPGQYNVWGTVIAVYLVGLGTTGMFMLGAPSYVEPVFDGAVLLVAIGLARLSARGLSST